MLITFAVLAIWLASAVPSRAAQQERGLPERLHAIAKKADLTDEDRVKVIRLMDEALASVSKSLETLPESRQDELVDYIKSALTRLPKDDGQSDEQRRVHFRQIHSGIIHYATSPVFRAKDVEEIRSQAQGLAISLLMRLVEADETKILVNAQVRKQLLGRYTQFFRGLEDNSLTPAFKRPLPHDVVVAEQQRLSSVEIADAVSPKILLSVPITEWKNWNRDKKAMYLNDNASRIATQIYARTMPILQTVVQTSVENFREPVPDNLHAASKAPPGHTVDEQAQKEFNKLWAEMLAKQQKAADDAKRKWEQSIADAERKVNEANSRARGAQNTQPPPAAENARWIIMAANAVVIAAIVFVLLRHRGRDRKYH
jgi:hypothetical protein